MKSENGSGVGGTGECLKGEMGEDGGTRLQISNAWKRNCKSRGAGKPWEGCKLGRVRVSSGCRKMPLEPCRKRNEEGRAGGRLG